MSLADAVESTLTTLDLAPVDDAAAALARALARLIDSPPPDSRPSDVRSFAAELARVLAELGATPAARARIASHQKPTVVAPSAAVDSLAAFRARKASE